MSHFTVLVVGEDVERQLQPFHEFECTGENDEFVQDVDQTEEVLAQMARSEKYDGSGKLEDGLGYFGLEDKVVASEAEVDKSGTHMYGYAVVQDGKLVKAVRRTNPNKQWDWWVIGGRWTGFFKLKPGRDGTTGEPGLMTPQAKLGYADQAVKAAIDFEAMREEAGKKASERYRKIHSIVGGRPIPNWTEVRERHGVANIDAAREEYNSNPVVRDIRENKETMWERSPFDFAVSEEVYVQRARDNAISTFAVLKDGKWYERGSMGWWGCVSDEKEDSVWNAEFSKLLDELPDDTLLTVVDCHI